MNKRDEPYRPATVVIDNAGFENEGMLTASARANIHYIVEGEDYERIDNVTLRLKGEDNIELLPVPMARESEEGISPAVYSTSGAYPGELSSAFKYAFIVTLEYALHLGEIECSPLYSSDAVAHTSP